MITSVSNPRVKWVRALQARPRRRREERALVVEGVRLAEEALASGWQARLVLHIEDLDPRGQALVQDFARQGAEVLCVTREVLASASDTQTPQGVLAVLAARSASLPAEPDFLLVVDGVRDPGNLGTMLRAAAAAGVDGVLLSAGCADPFAPKVLRAGMGAHFRLPVQRLDWPAIAAYLESRPAPGVRIYLAEAGQGLPYTQIDLHAPLALVIGGEAAGASEQARGLARECLHIPMPGGGESLNAAMAAAILLFEVVRQRAP
jgi:TrmH family RNA methyltransferase